MKIRVRHLLAFSGAAMVALAVACGDDAAPRPLTTTPVAAAPKKTEVAAAGAADGGTAAALPPYQYAYNPLGKRDPFRSFTEEIHPGGEEGAALCNEPLCQWDLEQLKLVAVVSGDANPLAMVEDPGGTGHMVRRNTRMGKQGGKVTQILRDCIIVTEYWTGPDGKVNPNPVKVCIHNDEGVQGVLDLMNPQKRY